jgi:hypothetical protein
MQPDDAGGSMQPDDSVMQVAACSLMMQVAACSLMMQVAAWTVVIAASLVAYCRKVSSVNIGTSSSSSTCTQKCQKQKFAKI